MSNLAIRVLVALVGIPAIVGLVYLGGYPFFLFIALVGTLALREFYDLAKAKGARPQEWMGLTLGVLVMAVFLHAKLSNGILTFFSTRGIALPAPTMSQSFLILFLVFIPLMLIRELTRNAGSALLNISVSVTGVLYVSMFFGSLIGLRELFIPADFPVFQFFGGTGAETPASVVDQIDRWGVATVLSLFASIWVCDSAAYFAGRAFGKHKLFPRVSPNKTWEGAIAGFVGAVATFLIARSTVIPYMTFTNAVVCGTIVGVFGQIGDLAESLLKRDAGVKDSSSLIPGHGGVLDRFDSVMFVAPLVFVYLDFVVF